MNHFTIAITFLLAAGLILAAVRYVRARALPLPQKITLTTLRILWIIGLILSFTEPTIKFERFESGAMRIPVLIDASLSMQNFSPEKSVWPFIDTLNALQSRTDGNVNFEYFLFGDSTRQYDPKTRSAQQDTRSVLPSIIDDGGKRFSDDMIIITDGHLTRARRSGEIFPRSNIRYLVLPEATPNPFVTISVDAPETAPVDSQFTVNVTASGFIGDAATLTVSLAERGRIIKTETAAIEQGYFTRPVSFKTSNPNPTRKLYTIEATADTAAPPAVSSFVHQTIPKSLGYAIHSAKPTLDKRFLSQALSADEFFKPRAASPDILFLLSWDSAAAQTMRKLPKHAVAVFAGCLPCSTGSIRSPSITVKEAANSGLSVSGADLRTVPPPQEIVLCANPQISNMRRMLTATVNAQANSDRGGETVPILFSGRFRGTRSLFCPVRGVWRWDFWPMSTDRTENELFGFSNTMISAARQMLLDNISDQLMIYPAQTLYETDSAVFSMSLPAATPIFEPVKLTLKVSGENTNIDTTMDYVPHGLNRQPLPLRPLPQGRYAISSTITSLGVRTTFADSFTVNKDMSELSVLAQNTQYLSEFASPLDTRDTDAINAAFDAWAARGAEKSTVTETIKLHRSWLMLLITLTLLGAELILRRRWELD